MILMNLVKNCKNSLKNLIGFNSNIRRDNMHRKSVRANISPGIPAVLRAAGTKRMIDKRRNYLVKIRYKFGGKTSLELKDAY